MNELPKNFSWGVFLVRELAIVAMATWWFVESLRRHDRIGAFVFSGLAAVILTVLNYLQTRHSNRRSAARSISSEDGPPGAKEHLPSRPRTNT